MSESRSTFCTARTAIMKILPLAAQFSILQAALAASWHNPILPGFHPDPSCILVEEWDNVYFCATSSFNVAPGVPVFASKDLQNFKQIGRFFYYQTHVLSILIIYRKRHYTSESTPWALQY